MKCASWKGKTQHTNLWPTNLDPETNFLWSFALLAGNMFFSEKIKPKCIVETRFRVVWWADTGYQEKTAVPENATPLPEENCFLINTKELALAKKKIGMHPRKTKMSPKEGPFQKETNLPNIMFWGPIRYSLLFRGPVLLYHLEWLSIFHEFWLLDQKNTIQL